MADLAFQRSGLTPRFEDRHPQLVDPCDGPFGREGRLRLCEEARFIPVIVSCDPDERLTVWSGLNAMARKLVDQVRARRAFLEASHSSLSATS